MRPHLGPWAPSRTRSSTVPLTKSGSPSYLGGGKTPSPQAHAAATADVFDATLEYCTPPVDFVWQPPCSFWQWTPSRFTVGGTSYLYAEQYFAAEKRRLFGDYHVLQNIMPVFDPKLHKQYRREVHNFYAVVLEHERENICLLYTSDAADE